MTPSCTTLRGMCAGSVVGNYLASQLPPECPDEVRASIFLTSVVVGGMIGVTENTGSKVIRTFLSLFQTPSNREPPSSPGVIPRGSYGDSPTKTVLPEAELRWVREHHSNGALRSKGP